MRRTKEQAAETARQVLEAAEKLFLEKGFDDVTLEEIATLAGVTRGAVHWHYNNKQGLLFALRDAAQEPFRKLAEEVVRNKGTASLERLGDLIIAMFARLESDPRQQGLLRATIRLDITLSEQSQESGSTFHKEMRSILLSILSAIEDNSELAASWKPDVVASILGATLNGFVIEWALGKDDFRLLPDGAAFVRMVLSSWRR